MVRLAERVKDGSSEKRINNEGRERMEAPYIMSNDDSSALAKKVLEVWKRSRLEATLRRPADGLMEPQEKKDADAGRGDTMTKQNGNLSVLV